MSGRVRVKICGVTTAADALAAIACGADALGFNTWPGSKRFVDLATAGEWIAQLPPLVARVAVLVNAPLQEAERVARLPFIDVVQLHGEETTEYCAQFARTGRPFIKALAAGPALPPAIGMRFCTRNILLDAAVPGAFGGTGCRVDAALAAAVVAANPDLRIILAGGLTPDNVADAMRRVRPYAVDVAGGVEAAPGRKDLARMRAFIAAVHGAAADVAGCGES